MERVSALTASDEPVFHRLEKTYAQRIQQLETEWPDAIDIILQTFRIGNLGIAAIPLKLLRKLGWRLKRKVL